MIKITLMVFLSSALLAITVAKGEPGYNWNRPSKTNLVYKYNNRLSNTTATTTKTTTKTTKNNWVYLYNNRNSTTLAKTTKMLADDDSLQFNQYE